MTNLLKLIFNEGNEINTDRMRNLLIKNLKQTLKKTHGSEHADLNRSQVELVKRLNPQYNERQDYITDEQLYEILTKQEGGNDDELDYLMDIIKNHEIEKQQRDIKFRQLERDYKREQRQTEELKNQLKIKDKYKWPKMIAAAVLAATVTYFGIVGQAKKGEYTDFDYSNVLKGTSELDSDDQNLLLEGILISKEMQNSSIVDVTGPRMYKLNFNSQKKYKLSQREKDSLRNPNDFIPAEYPKDYSVIN